MPIWRVPRSQKSEGSGSMLMKSDWNCELSDTLYMGLKVMGDLKSDGNGELGEI